MRGEMTWEETIVSSQGTNYRLRRRRPVFHPNGTLRLRVAHAGQGGRGTASQKSAPGAGPPHRPRGSGAAMWPAAAQLADILCFAFP